MADKKIGCSVTFRGEEHWITKGGKVTRARLHSVSGQSTAVVVNGKAQVVRFRAGQSVTLANL